jgi:MFS family permease
VTPPFFYGWIIVAISMIAGFFSAGVSIVTMAVVLKPISDDLGWSRALTAAAVTIGAISGGVLSPFFGPIADRLGPRLLLPAGGALVGLLAIGVSVSTEPWQFYATFTPARALTEFLLCGIVPFTAVANWFYLKRPRALGLVAMSVPLGASALSLVYQFFVTHYGWRSAFLALGIALWALVVIPGVIFLRRQPEDLGLNPDGAPALLHEAALSEQGDLQKTVPETTWSRGDALRTRSLWLLVASSFLASLGTGGIGFHSVAYFTDNRVSPGIAAGALSVMALSGALGNGLWGALAERIHPRRLIVATMLISAAAIALLLHRTDLFTVYVFAAIFGLNARGASVLIQVLLARYFGRRSFGAISSILDPFHKSGLGLGPFFAGMAFDFTNSYRVIFLIFLGNYLIAALLLSLARRPLAGGMIGNARLPGAVAKS